MNFPLNLLIFAATTYFVLASSYDDYDEDSEDLSSIDTSAPNGTLVFTQLLRNLTVDDGAKFLKLICEVDNLDRNRSDVFVTFRWYVNDVTPEKSKRLTVKTTQSREFDWRWRSFFRLTNVEVHDKGFYDCVATNGIDKIRSQAFVEVTASPRWSSSSTSTLPNNNGGLLKFDSEGTTVAMTGGGDLDVAPSSGGAKTFDLSPTGKLLDSVPKSGDFYNSTEPFCQVYRGKTCRKYLKDRYVFVQPSYTQSEIEDELSQAFLVISQSKDISSNCNKFARPSLCYSAFPLCQNPMAVNNYQSEKTSKFLGANRSSFKTIRNELSPHLSRICKDDCLLLETELCSKEYAIAKRHPVISKTLQLEECEFLPDLVDDLSQGCLSLGVDEENVDKEDSCFWDDGQLYRGVQNVTGSGEKCLRWSHQFHVTLSEHPELSGHNYCRNPGGNMEWPFCYVDQNRKEMCDILKCANVVTMYVVASFAFVTVFVVVIVAAVCCRRKNKARNIQNLSVPSADKNIYGNHHRGPNSPMEMNSLLPPNIPPQRGHHSSKNAYQNVPQYTYKEVAFVEELGEGAFGKVYKGELKTANGKIFVAVKSLKENASAKTQADFQREIELISELKHPNIICLLGVVVKQEPMCMLFEFMSEGDLHEFLMGNSPSEGKSLTQNQFLHIAIQIAQGMEYLSENHYVHRDLAARNCLVSKDLVVKISDFGLSRDMYSCDYYRVQSKSLLPVRWMPPESILYGKFTTESDVWSYGVVLWEIYSYGLQPYYGYNNQEVINMIRSRKLLPCPDACPSYCYALMVECWAELAVRRPNFAEIAYRLRLWKQNGNYNNGAYFRTTPDGLTAGPPPPPPMSSTKSLKCSESPSVCQSGTDLRPESCSATWERGLGRNDRHLTESQSSLTSRSSSLGNRTQSTSLSTDNHHHHHARHHNHPRKVKNTMVSSNGENFEIKITK